MPADLLFFPYIGHGGVLSCQLWCVPRIEAVPVLLFEQEDLGLLVILTHCGSCMVEEAVGQVDCRGCVLNGNTSLKHTVTPSLPHVVREPLASIWQFAFASLNCGWGEKSTALNHTCECLQRT